MKTLIYTIFTLCIISLTPVTYAYCVYNKTKFPLEMKDTHPFGMKRTISAQDSACCNPKNVGCRGNMHIVISNYYDTNKVDCDWHGKIKGRGHYFEVNKVNEDDQYSPCTIDHKRDSISD